MIIGENILKALTEDIIQSDIELIVWLEQGNQGDWREQDDQGEVSIIKFGMSIREAVIYVLAEFVR